MFRRSSAVRPQNLSHPKPRPYPAGHVSLLRPRLQQRAQRAAGQAAHAAVSGTTWPVLCWAVLGMPAVERQQCAVERRPHAAAAPALAAHFNMLRFVVPPCFRCSALGEGVEYLLADSQPPHLFILRKMYRHAATPVSSQLES